MVAIKHATLSSELGGGEKIGATEWDADHDVPIASQAEAEAGTSSTKLMTPQRTAQAISALGGNRTVLTLAAAEVSGGDVGSGLGVLIQDANGDWSVPITSGHVYRLQVLATFQAPTTGAAPIAILFAATSGGVIANPGGILCVQSGDSETDTAMLPVVEAGSMIGASIASAVPTANKPYFASIDLTFRCTTSGTLEVRLSGLGLASSAQLNVGSALIFERLT